MKISDIGLIGPAVTGENLTLNMESKGFTVSIYDRTAPGEEDAIDRFTSGRGEGKNFIGTHTIQEFVEFIERPRGIMLMVKAGASVDELMAQLIPYLSPGDVIIDGGNSDFHNTERRMKGVEAHGTYFIDAGISGGEISALYGPSVMPGDSPAAWPLVKDILRSITARLDGGTPCCQQIGLGGAGHFVKMVHNGIEYGDMQLIFEAYSLLKNRLDPDNGVLVHIFEDWNTGELDSCLIGIATDILRFKDGAGEGYLLDKILDATGQKGIGKWSVIVIMDKSDPLTLITEAAYARILSSVREKRKKASSLYPKSSVSGQTLVSKKEIKRALYATKLVFYAQGFSSLYQASKRYDWQLDYGTIVKIWRKGCIIRSVLLEKITQACEKNRNLENLLFDKFFIRKIESSLLAWQQVVAEGALHGVVLPTMSSGLSYFDRLSAPYSAASLIQTQRDYFGAHTYRRVDWERGRFFHTNWTGEGGKTVSGTYNI